MLKANSLYKSFGNNSVLEGLSFEIADGSIAGLIGPSGGGKSVLMKILSGIYEIDSGEVSNSYRSTSLMFQEGALFDSMTVFDNVAFPLVNGKVPVSSLDRKTREEVTEKVGYILTRVGLDHAATKMPGQLSGGMRRRASLARALVNKPELVLLDDPTSGLDPVASSVIMQLIVELHDEYNPTMLLISHDLRRLLRVVDPIYCLFNGEIVFTGNLAELEKLDNKEVLDFVTCRFDFNEIQAA